MDTLRTQFVSAVLKSLFDDEAHAHQFGTGLIHQVNNALGGIKPRNSVAW